MSNDPKSRFDRKVDDFDREFDRMKKVGIAFSVISVFASISLAGFVIWVIVMLMRFYGVI